MQLQQDQQDQQVANTLAVWCVFEGLRDSRSDPGTDGPLSTGLIWSGHGTLGPPELNKKTKTSEETFALHFTGWT